MPPAAVPRLRYQLIAVTLVRLMLNTAHRMIYPFLPAFSRGLGMPVDTLTRMVSARNALGLASPLFGALPDRLGRRLALLIGVGVFCFALALAGLLPGYVTLFAALMLVVVAKVVFDPAMQAYFGDRTPYAQRGLVIALTELAWSGAALVGIPLAGLLIQRTGSWHVAFLPLAGLGLAGGLALWFIIPVDARRSRHASGPRAGLRSVVLGRPAVLAALSIGLLISAANESLNVVYGRWMEASFHLPVAALGLSTTVIGIAELAGEGLVMAWVDRLGKRRAMAIGAAASALAYAALPLLTFNLFAALTGMFFVFVTFEFAIVASLPFMTELAPEARGVVMSTNVAAHASGRMLGALLGSALFPLGFHWNGLTAAGLNVLTLGVIVLLVRERRLPPPVRPEQAQETAHVG